MYVRMQRNFPLYPAEINLFNSKKGSPFLFRFARRDKQIKFVIVVIFLSSIFRRHGAG